MVVLGDRIGRWLHRVRLCYHRQRDSGAREQPDPEQCRDATAALLILRRLRYNRRMALRIRTFVQATTAIAIAWSTSCVDKGPVPAPKKIDSGYIAEHLLNAVPADVPNRLDVDLGASVRYLGNRVPQASVIPGVAFRVTHYWQVLAVPGKQWRVFSHVRSADPGDFLNADRSDMRVGHGPATWQPGEIIEDSQEITLPPGWRENRKYFCLACFSRANMRLLTAP